MVCKIKTLTPECFPKFKYETRTLQTYPCSSHFGSFSFKYPKIDIKALNFFSTTSKGE
jgi:hypothetical protein